MIKDRLEYDKKVIGENLRELRVAKNISIEEVREYLQIVHSRQFINGRRADVIRRRITYLL